MLAAVLRGARVARVTAALAAAVRLEESGRRKRWGWEPVEVRVRISSGEFGLPVLG